MTSSGAATVDRSQSATSVASQAVFVEDRFNVVNGTAGSLRGPVVVFRIEAEPVPNAETLAALAEVDRGEGRTFGTVDELFADLQSDD